MYAVNSSQTVGRLLECTAAVKRWLLGNNDLQLKRGKCLVVLVLGTAQHLQWGGLCASVGVPTPWELLQMKSLGAVIDDDDERFHVHANTRQFVYVCLLYTSDAADE